MPPRGVKKGTKRARQYEHVKQSERQAGRSADRAEEIAARTVNKEKARSDESKTRLALRATCPLGGAAASARAAARADARAISSTTTPRSSTSRAARA